MDPDDELFDINNNQYSNEEDIQYNEYIDNNDYKDDEEIYDEDGIDDICEE